ncbi:hypothetical protein [Filifactor alocis]|uniref:hypothetical protein n=1 Tax=Filifactor alocis TaxID=143361 RepID=UPI003FA0385A
MMNVTELQQFEKMVEDATAWNDIEVEDYQKAFESVGLDFTELSKEYEDPDKVWSEFTKKLRELEK